MSAAVAGTPVVGGYVTQRARAAITGTASEIEEMTIAQMQTEMAAGRLPALQLVQKYLTRIDAIDRRGPRLELGDRSRSRCRRDREKPRRRATQGPCTRAAAPDPDSGSRTTSTRPTG